MLIFFAWSLVILLVAYGAVWWLFLRNDNNEFAPGVEIDEEDLAEAIQGDMLDFIREQNGVK